MGELTDEPDHVGAFAAGAAKFAELDEAVWDPISTATLARTRPKFDELVLDACSGDGASALPAAELVGPGGLVDAVDLAEELIGLARARAGDRLPQLRLHVADVTSWEPTGYDLVQCVLGVFFFADMDAGTRHLIERAKPGGRVGVTVWARGALGSFLEALTSALPGEHDDEHHSPAFEGIDTPGGLARWLTGLGLQRVRADEARRHVEVSPDLAWSLVEGTAIRNAIAGLDDEEVAGVRERFTARLEESPEARTLDLTTLIAVGYRPDAG
ncbi:class I SAM-dependent methyltransferase [Agromyces sp. NPDC055658]